jgi:hypothetical protein
MYIALRPDGVRADGAPRQLVELSANGQDDRLISIDGTTAADRAVVAAVPPGYVSLDPTHGEHLLGVLRNRTPVHSLIAGERGSTCQRWTPGTLQPDSCGGWRRCFMRE